MAFLFLGRLYRFTFKIEMVWDGYSESRNGVIKNKVLNFSHFLKLIETETQEFKKKIRRMALSKSAPRTLDPKFVARKLI